MKGLCCFMQGDNRQQNTLGVDIGGTKIETALVDASGAILASHYRLINPAKEPAQTIQDILDSVQICYRESGKSAVGMGVGVAGQIDKINGVVCCSPNLPDWKNVALGAGLQSSLGIPVTINNDVRMITWGEWQHGAGKGVDDLVCLFVGTGVGGGVISGGRLFEGPTNTAGELGHMTILAGGRQCHCPNQGCLEAYCGGWAIAERARDAARANLEAGKTLIELAGKIENITAITVSQAYANFDPLAQRLVKDTALYLAAGMVSIVNAFNPHLIILGGSVIQGMPDLVSMAEKRIRLLALPTPVKDLRITVAALGNKAGVIGAAAVARQLATNKKQ
jgi:glucokinase